LEAEMEKSVRHARRVRDKLGPSSRKSKPQALAGLSQDLKVRLIAASVMEAKSEAEIIRACLETGLEELGY
jgi:hypothetical protein